MDEMTLGDIFEEIADRLATARTKALMGEREEALGLFQGASLEYTRFQDVLAEYPGHLALKYAFDATMATLSEQKAATLSEEPMRFRTHRKRHRAA